MDQQNEEQTEENPYEDSLVMNNDPSYRNWLLNDPDVWQ